MVERMSQEEYDALHRKKTGNKKGKVQVQDRSCEHSEDDEKRHVLSRDELVQKVADTLLKGLHIKDTAVRAAEELVKRAKLDEFHDDE